MSTFIVTISMIAGLAVSLLGFWIGIWHQYSRPLVHEDIQYLAAIAQFILTCCIVLAWLLY